MLAAVRQEGLNLCWLSGLLMNILSKLHKIKNTSHGITLVEVLLYVSVVAIVLTAMSAYYGALMRSQVKNTTVLEVEQQGVLVAQKMMQAVRNAEAVGDPTPGNEASSLSLDMQTGSSDPTIFSLSDGALEISEGGAATVPLTNKRVMVEELLFENLARDGTAGIIQFTLRIAHINPSGQYEYSYEQTFQSSSMIRQPE